MPSLRTVVAAVAIAAITIWGWNEFWFLTDDAFIAFRHVANLIDGYGPTWNREPFAPVEGCTSWSWVFIHAGIWWACGVEPPEITNIISLLCALATLAVCSAACRRARGAYGPGGGVLTFATLAAIATHPIFLTWSSSGLETPLLILCVVAWVYFATMPVERQGARQAWALSSLSVAIALTRPDGLAFVGTTVGIFAVRAWTDRARLRTILAASIPFLAIVFQFASRRAYFGVWLPNTYYAKVVEPWPESGLRYFGVFAVENGVWLWVPFTVIALVVGARRAQFEWRHLVTRHFGAVAAVGVVGFTVAYYSIRVGGDHFGFRVFSPVVPLMFIGFFAACTRLRLKLPVALAILVIFTVATHTIGWVRHRALAEEQVLEPTPHSLDESSPRWLRRVVETPMAANGFVALAPRFPGVLAPVLAPLDQWNAWMQAHLVCMPRAVHVRALRSLVDRAPLREAGLAIDWSQRPVISRAAVGMVGWCMPNVAIIDVLGLNDRVVARSLPEPIDPNLTPEFLFGFFDKNEDGMLRAGELPDDQLRILSTLADRDGDGELDTDEFAAALDVVSGRRMAHDRAPPPGYIEAFRPNVRIEDGEVFVDPRAEPLTDEGIREIERRFFEQVTQGNP